MAALTQKAWYEDRYSAGGHSAQAAGQSGDRDKETRDAAVRYIRSQIGIGTLVATGQAPTPRFVDF